MTLLAADHFTPALLHPSQAKPPATPHQVIAPASNWSPCFHPCPSTTWFFTQLLGDLLNNQIRCHPCAYLQWPLISLSEHPVLYHGSERTRVTAVLATFPCHLGQFFPSIALLQSQWSPGCSLNKPTSRTLQFFLNEASSSPGLLG